MKLIDFDNCQRLKGRGYRGKAGRKLAYLYNGKIWMVKFPGITKDMTGKYLPSYVSIPLNEYIGSKIYEFLGLPVHETVLGKCDGKIVVGCRDFTDRGELIEYSQIKNMVDDKFISGRYGSSNQGERLSDVLRIIEMSEEFEGIREDVRMRFWDMFIVDMFIHNNNRNNGNWGLLIGKENVTLAPVFGNGNAFRTDFLSTESFFLDDKDKRIDPIEYIQKTDNQECRKALERFIHKIDMDKIKHLIEEIPEQEYGMTIIDSDQKRFYIELLSDTYNAGILPMTKKSGYK